jgi:uncharacterized protein (DUF2236 family)
MGQADDLTASSNAREPSPLEAASSRRRRDSLTRAIPPLPLGRAGDPGRFGPASVVWRVHRERALLLSAPAVVLMQLAHPLVAAAVAEHTNRDRSVVERAGATIGLNLAVIFGDGDQAERAASHVRDLHTAIHGQLHAAVGSFPAGSSYRADDPELLRWGHATIAWAAIEAYERFIESLASADRDRYVAEMRPFGQAFGADQASLPSTWDELRAYVSDVVDNAVAIGEDGRREGREILWPRGTFGERASGPVQRVLAAGLLPATIRHGFALPLSTERRATFSSLAAITRAAVRTMPRSIRWWPHYRTACERMAGK